MALEQPVARDLRVLLTARDVAQLGELCLGLCFTLARRANRVQLVLSDDVRAMILEVGEAVALLLTPCARRRTRWSVRHPLIQSRPVSPDEQLLRVPESDLIASFPRQDHLIGVTSLLDKLPRHLER